MMATISFSPLVSNQFQLGESPTYDERRDALWFCDIVGHALHRVSLREGDLETWKFESEVCSLGLAESGRLVIALRQDVVIFDPDTGQSEKIASIEAGRDATRLNDGKVAPDGSFWVGTMDDRAEKEPIAALYRVDPSGKVERKIEGLFISNGLAFSKDGSAMFHSDSRGPWIDRWRFDVATGAITDRKRIAVLDDTTGRPDGGAMDMEDNYWSAGVSAARLNCFSGDGELTDSYPVPVAAPSMPCFGGAGFDTIFVTSIRHNRSDRSIEEFPLTGSVIYGKSPSIGVPISRFRDI